MLIHISIVSFGILKNLDLEVHPALTVITGETGAGKSILLDALLFALGLPTQRTPLAEQEPDVSLTFQYESPSPISEWLDEHHVSDGTECMIRRVLMKSGRSRFFINGRNLPMNTLKTLTPMLISIHGQNSQQRLLQPSEQQILVDQFAHLSDDSHTVKQLVRQYNTVQQQLQEHQDRANSHGDRLELLRYQLSELEELDIQEDEFNQLSIKEKQMGLIEQAQNECHSAQMQLEQTRTELERLPLEQWKSTFTSLENAHTLHESFLITAQELENEFKHFLSHSSMDSQERQRIQDRLSQLHDVARKHKTKPHELIDQVRILKNEMNGLNDHEQLCAELTQQLATLKERYQKTATNLSKKRQEAAKKLSKIITKALPSIGLQHGRFEVRHTVTESPTPQTNGIDALEFWVQLNPGQPTQPLHKVASGGELSRISLLLQIHLPSTLPRCLVFDEVDAGISGKIAHVIGQLLHDIAKRYQAVCITHLPQVAANGEHHWHVRKHQTKESTEVFIQELNHDERKHALAEMLSSDQPTKASLQQAQNLLEMNAITEKN